MSQPSQNPSRRRQKGPTFVKEYFEKKPRRKHLVKSFFQELWVHYQSVKCLFHFYCLVEAVDIVFELLTTRQLFPLAFNVSLLGCFLLHMATIRSSDTICLVITLIIDLLSIAAQGRLFVLSFVTQTTSSKIMIVGRLILIGTLLRMMVPVVKNWKIVGAERWKRKTAGMLDTRQVVKPEPNYQNVGASQVNIADIKVSDAA